MSAELSTRVRTIMEREMETFGLSILKTQCKQLNIVEENIRPDDLPALASRLSELLRTCGGYDKAKRVYRDIRALQDLDELAEREESTEVKIEILENLARASLFAGEWEKASKYIDQLLSSASAEQDRAAKSRYLMWMGMLHMDKSELEVAMALFEKALTEAKEADDTNQLSKCYYRIGDIHWYKGEFKKARESYEMAVSVGTDDSDIGAAHIGIANVYQSREELAKAITHYVEALAKLKNTDDYRDTARAYNNLGDVYMQMDNWDSALENFEKGAELGELSGWLYIKAFTQFNSAEALINKGELDRAWELLEKSRELLEQIGSKPGLAGMYHVYGMYHREKEEWEKMSENYERSIELYEEITMPHYVARDSYEYGIGLLRKGDTKKARTMLSKALEIFEGMGMEKMTRKVRRELDKI
jgi:tetratricopeptide (TPR) repeat protein